MELHAILEEKGDWWIGYVEEIPGANTQGRSKDEVLENLVEAVNLVLDANRDFARRESEGKNVIREDLALA